MGGILANNSSGMCCGVAQNAYHTLDSLTFALPSGTVIDTAAAGRRRRLPRTGAGPGPGPPGTQGRNRGRPRPGRPHPLQVPHQEHHGYSLNAFLDFARPLDIFRNLLVGSEGTLAFIAEAVLRTVPDLPVKVTGLLLFPDLRAACAAIAPLKEAGRRGPGTAGPGLPALGPGPAGLPAAIRALPEGAGGPAGGVPGAAEDRARNWSARPWRPAPASPCWTRRLHPRPGEQAACGRCARASSPPPAPLRAGAPR